MIDALGLHHHASRSEEADWQRLGQYLRKTDSQLLSDDVRKRHLSTWDDIADKEQKLDDALLIGLVGGTGVGKSTFINALAGEEISRSSDRRPTTDRIVVYRHADIELPPDLPTDEFSQPQVLHGKKELAKAILFDFPDFDSAEKAHHAIIKRYVGHLDVLLVVVDDVKYADRRLYELLSSINHDPANLFVLFNKVDRLQNRYEEKTAQVIEELLVDVRQKMSDNAGLNLQPEQVFPIAAKSVMEARSNAVELSDDLAKKFDRIESLLESYQYEKHRKAAKERNIDTRKLRLAAELSSTALGHENESILNDSSTMIADWRTQIDETLNGIPVEVLSDRDRRGLRRQRLRKAGSHWGLPFSLLFTLVTELRRSRFKAPATELSAMGARIFQHYRGFLEAIGNLRARFESDLHGSSIAEALKESTDAPVDRPIDKEHLSDELAADFQRHLSQRTRRPRFVSKMACHVPAIATLVLAVWSRIYPILASATGESDRGLFRSVIGAVIGSLSPTFVIGTILGVVFVYLVTAMFIWLREVQIMEGDIHDGEVAVRKIVAQRGGEVVDRLDDQVRGLRDEFDRLRSLLHVRK